VASTLGSHQAGLYVREDSGFDGLDGVSSTGLAISGDRRHLARLLWSERDSDAPGEYVIYDTDGVTARRTVEELRQPHSALWSGDSLIVVSTGTNAVLWLDAAGAVEHRWQAPGSGDCWHLNSLAWDGAQLLVSAFGRFEERLGWVDRQAREGTGFVFEIPSQRVSLEGISSPHNPLRFGGGWLICESAHGLLLELDGQGRRLREVGFDGWTRGLAYDEEFIYVGVSAHRLRGEAGESAFVATVSRESFDEVDRWTLPAREVYDLLVVPERLIRAVRRSTIDTL